MKINIGTKSPTKIKAIEELVQNYDIFKGVSIESIKALSGVSDQPKSLEETLKGASNRAKNAFADCDFSFGIESGIMPVPEAKTGYMNVTACSIFDGKSFYLGLASCFEYPMKVTKLMLSEEIEASAAFKKSGLTEKDKIGYSDGGIGFVTNGRINCVDYYKQAVVNALTHIENPHLYE